MLTYFVAIMRMHYLLEKIRVGSALAALLLFGVACDEQSTNYGVFEHLLANPPGEFRLVSSYDTTGGNMDRLEIAAGDSVVLLDTEGPGIIQRLWLTVASADEHHYLRRISLKMYWDDEVEPSVHVPLGDFFGNGFEKTHYAALPMGISSGGFYSYLPMPFKRRAVVVVENGTGIDLDAFYFQIGLQVLDDTPSELPTFHAWWNRDKRTDGSSPHLVLSAEGQGHFVGMSLNAESYENSFWFLEGDESFFVDGEFRGQGTGTEDYFNSGWYFQHGLFAAPYHGVLLKDAERGRIAAYRWHIPDPIRFTDSLRVSLAHGHGNEVIADYATVAYWYQTEPHKTLPSLPPAHDRKTLGTKIPLDAVLASEFIVPATDSVPRLSVRVPRPDRYDVSVFPVGGPDLELAGYQLSGHRPQFVSLSAPDSNTVLAPVFLGTISGEDWVSIDLVDGTPLPAAVGLSPQRVWALAWNVVGPFPNPRVLGSEVSPAIDYTYGPELDPSLDSIYVGLEGDSLRWMRVSADTDGQVRLNQYFTPNDRVAAYAMAFLYSPNAREVSILLSADDAHVLWVNGTRLSERQGRHISRPDELEVRTRINAGWNRVLIKVADLDGGWAFQLRVADPDGTLRWSANRGR